MCVHGSVFTLELLLEECKESEREFGPEYGRRYDRVLTVPRPRQETRIGRVDEIRGFPVDERSQDSVEHYDYTIEAVYTGAAKITMTCLNCQKPVHLFKQCGVA